MCQSSVALVCGTPTRTWRRMLDADFVKSEAFLPQRNSRMKCHLITPQTYTCIVFDGRRHCSWWRSVASRPQAPYRHKQGGAVSEAHSTFVNFSNRASCAATLRPRAFLRTGCGKQADRAGGDRALVNGARSGQSTFRVRACMAIQEAPNGLDPETRVGV